MSFNDKLVTADELARLSKTWQKPDNGFSSFGHSPFVKSNQNLFTQLLGPLCLLQCIYVPGPRYNFRERFYFCLKNVKLLINRATANQTEPTSQLSVLSVRGWICHEAGGDFELYKCPEQVYKYT